LLDYAGITGEVVLTCMLNKVEVWDKKAHQEMISNEPENFAELAEEVMAIKEGGAMSNYHTPVMLAECIEALNIKPNGTYVDVTFGGGGHSREIMKHLGEGGQLLAFDQDADAQQNMMTMSALLSSIKTFVTSKILPPA
jgi:ubiquinone/menaquinone biosynthesis C-methylase UbiE